MNDQQRKLDQQLADFTDQMELGLEVDIESYYPNVQELISTVQLTAKGIGVQMPGENTYKRLKNRAFAEYKKEFPQNSTLQSDNIVIQLKNLLTNFRLRPILQYGLIATVIIAAIFILPVLDLDNSGLTGAAGSGQDFAPVVATIFLVVLLIFWLLNRRRK